MGLRRTRKKNQPKNVRYNAEKRWVKNKIKKLERHIEKCHNDKQAMKELRKLKERPVVTKEEGNE